VSGLMASACWMKSRGYAATCLLPTHLLVAANRFCKYPQELVLRLERPSKVQQIQILAHEYKVRHLCSQTGQTASLAGTLHIHVVCP